MKDSAKARSYVNAPELNKDHIEYLEKGFFNIVKTNNCASIAAFPSELLNARGIFIDFETFKNILETFEAECNFSLIPEKFIFQIRKSPISLFKSWVFKISEKPILSISQRSRGIERDFFPLSLKNSINVVPITTNVAHERFLLSVYSRKKLEEYTINLSTQLTGGKSLVIYKDYAKKKISTLTLKKTLLSNKIYPMNITVRRELSKIKFKLVVANKYTAEHSIKFKKPIRASANERTLHENQKLFEENEKKVIDIISKFDGKTIKTNNYANISLGRIARVPILITLPDKAQNANVDIKINYFSKTKTIEVKDKDGATLKVVSISSPPKSNWLKRIRNT